MVSENLEVIEPSVKVARRTRGGKTIIGWWADVLDGIVMESR